MIISESILTIFIYVMNRAWCSNNNKFKTDDRALEDQKDRWLHQIPGIFKAESPWQRYLLSHVGGFAECFEAERIGDKKKFALKIVHKKLLEKPKARQKVYDFLCRCCRRSNSIKKPSTKIFANSKEFLKMKKMCTCFWSFVPMEYFIPNVEYVRAHQKA